MEALKTILDDLRKYPAILAFFAMMWAGLAWNAYQNRMPFGDASYLAVAVNGGPPAGPPRRMIYAYPCDRLDIVRRVYADRTVAVSISRLFRAPDPVDSYPLLPGGQVFQPGLNVMTPHVQVPFDIAPGVAYSYQSALYDEAHRPLPLPAFGICVLAPGSPLPKEAGACPPPPPGYEGARAAACPEAVPSG